MSMNYNERKNDLKYMRKELKIFYKIADKLEQRIATAEKVLEKHAICIGIIKGVKPCPTKKQ